MTLLTTIAHDQWVKCLSGDWEDVGQNSVRDSNKFFFAPRSWYDEHYIFLDKFLDNFWVVLCLKDETVSNNQDNIKSRQGITLRNRKERKKGSEQNTDSTSILESTAKDSQKRTQKPKAKQKMKVQVPKSAGKYCCHTGLCTCLWIIYMAYIIYCLPLNCNN